MMDEEEIEDQFYADGGVYEQIHDRVNKYIEENRDVVKTKDIDYKTMTFAEIEEVTAHSPGTYRNYVLYSAYDNYTDNLDKVAVEGRVQFFEECDDPNEMGFVMGNVPYDTRKDYRSPIMENPTWLEVALLANDMINCTGDNHHVYLEAIRPSDTKFTLDDKSFVTVYRFSMGS